MLKKYTIRDIATLAGVSKGTVDRVLHKRGKVSESALNKVNEILEKIDYTPNPIAKNLKNNKIFTICVLVPDPEKDSYWAPCIKGIDEILIEFGAFGIYIETVFFNPSSTNSFVKANKEIQRKSPEAVLLVPLFFKETQLEMATYKKMGIIVSTFNNHIDSFSVKSFIGQDLYQSGRVGAKLLQSIVSSGHIAIFHVYENYENSVFMQEKEKGFKSYFEALNSDKYTILMLYLKQSNFESSLTSFIEKQPNLKGIFVTTSKTHLVADILEKKKFDSIALVGYDLLQENIYHLKNGSIDFLIHQHPKQQTYYGLKHLVEYFLFDKDIPKQMLLPIDIINSENVGFFEVD